MNDGGTICIKKIPKKLAWEDIDRHFRSGTKIMYRKDCVISVQHPIGANYTQALVKFSTVEAARYYSGRQYYLINGQRVSIEQVTTKPKTNNTGKGPNTSGHADLRQASHIPGDSSKHANTHSTNFNKGKYTSAFQHEQVKPSEAAALKATSANVQLTHANPHNASGQCNRPHHESPEPTSTTKKSDGCASKHAQFDHGGGADSKGNSSSAGDGSSSKRKHDELGQETDSSLFNESQSLSIDNSTQQRSSATALSGSPRQQPVFGMDASLHTLNADGKNNCTPNRSDTHGNRNSQPNAAGFTSDRQPSQSNISGMAKQSDKTTVRNSSDEGAKIQYSAPNTGHTEHTTKWDPLPYDPTPAPADKASISPGRNTSGTHANDYPEDQQATSQSPASEDRKSSHDPRSIVTDLWKFLTLTKAKALKKIERQHNIHRRSDNIDWPDLTDLTAEYSVGVTHSAIDEMMSLYRVVFGPLDFDERGIEKHYNRHTVTMALNQTKAMYANVLMKEKHEGDEMRVLFYGPSDQQLAKGAKDTFERFVGPMESEHSLRVTHNTRLADRSAHSKEKHSPKHTECRHPSYESNRCDTSKLHTNEESCDEEESSQTEDSNFITGKIMPRLDNDESKTVTERNRSEQLEMKTVEGGDWVKITEFRGVETKENAESLSSSDAHQNLNNGDHGKKQIMEHTSSKVPPSVSETVGHNFGTEACGLTGTDTTSDPADVLSQDQERSVTEPSEIFSQPASGKFSTSMNKKKHLLGHDKEGLQKLMFQFSSGTQETGREFAGKTIAAASFTAYLPNSDQGKTLMKLLRKAFGARKLFKTTGGSLDEMRLEPNGVVLKSEIEGENGYPDPTYLDQLEKDLETLGFHASQSLPVSLKKNEDTHMSQPVSDNPCWQPSGNFKPFVENKKDLKGFEKQGTQQLVFEFSAGRDEGGHKYEAKSFTAYLPNSENGKKLSNLLKKAFDQRVLFKIVPNTSMFNEPGCNSLVPNNVSFKSERSGTNGYPDPTYLDQLEKELGNLSFRK